MNELDPNDNSVGYGGLTAAERVIFCLNGLETEVNSGGFIQYFSNSTGDHARDAPAALRTLGAPKVATLIEQAIALIPGALSPDQSAREAQMAALSDPVKHGLELLDAEQEAELHLHSQVITGHGSAVQAALPKMRRSGRA